MPVPNQSAICVGSACPAHAGSSVPFLKKIVAVVYFEPTLRKSEVRSAPGKAWRIQLAEKPA
jgi:hypothetical protein